MSGALSLTKVAFGCASMDELAARVKWRADRGEDIHMTTRYLPKRHAEILGGSLYWIVKHKLVARSPILRFGEAEGGRTDIVLEARLIPVRATPRRAHQGWRYLEAKDAPADLGGDADLSALPPELVSELTEAGLL